MKKTMVLGVLLALVVGLTGCGGDGGGSAEATSASTLTSISLSEDYAEALPVSAQLAIGMLMLDETEDAVTAEQAGELLTLWQMLHALQVSGTASQAELDAVVDQIQGTMTHEQLAAIREMKLTTDSMTGLVQELGLGRGLAGGAGGAGGFQPPAGMGPGGGGFGGGGMLGAGENLSPEEQEAAAAERMNAFAGTAMTGMVVSMLEARAEGETWEVTASNQEVALQRALLGVVAEVTGLDEQEIMTRTGEGQTLQEVAEANGADAEQILAQIVAAEAERVNQAVADGALEQAEADQYLVNLETLAREMLQGAWQFGGRGDDGPGQP
jgi:hypothetical protein